MERRIEGTFAGGPGRTADPESLARALSLRPARALEAVSARKRVIRSRDRRRRRALIGTVTAIIVSGGSGLAWGLGTRVTAQDLNEMGSAGQEEQQATRDLNRALLELWRMEDVEYRRSARAVRGLGGGR